MLYHTNLYKKYHNFNLLKIIKMYQLQDTILKTNIGKGNKDRHTITKNLLNKLCSRVYSGDCDKATYRNAYHAIETNNFEYINKVLEYETGYKILFTK